MRHLSEGVLRRMYDDPDAMGTDERAHFAACPTCQDRFQRVGDDARQVRAALDVTPVPADPHDALARLRAQLNGAPPRRRAPRVPVALTSPLSSLGWRKPVLATGLGLLPAHPAQPVARSVGAVARVVFRATTPFGRRGIARPGA